MRVVLASGGALLLGGISSAAPGGNTPDAAAGQAEAVFDALEARLAAAGGALHDVCKITMQITDRAFRQAVYAVMGRRLLGVRPVSTGLIVNGLDDPHALFQLDAWAAPGGPHERLRSYRSTSVPYGTTHQPFVAEFCMVVKAGRDVFLRGQTGMSLDGTFTGAGDPGAQARVAMDNVETLLADAGATLADAVHVTVYVTDRAWLSPALRAVVPRFAASPVPLSVLVVKGLAAPEILMEVDVRAQLG
ncbi:RidA family protein [Falsiroseomonas sp.]|uniref:RidA family protein n=1 Tax=Falsiroseomonas sp. TaxID=2870721 RepID=UPI003567BF03